MPRTLENHLVGVTADAPHPDSYRPDLPLRSELAPSPLEEEHEAETESAYETGYEKGCANGRFEGKEEGFEDGADEYRAKLRKLEIENADLRAQLEAKAS